MDKLPKIPDNRPLQGRDYNRLVDFINRSTRIRVGEGLQIKRTAAGQMIYAEPSQRGITQTLFVILTGAVPITHVDIYNHQRRRWIYQWYEVWRKQTGATVSWERRPGGIGTDEEGGEYPGAQNGADWAWIGDPSQPKDLYISPVPVGTVVELKIFETADGWIECWFEAPTNHDTQAPQEGVISTRLIWQNPSDVWSIYRDEGNVAKGRCIELKMIEDVVYDNMTRICKQYFRHLIFDPTGRLVRVSGRQDENVFIAVECPEG